VKLLMAEKELAGLRARLTREEGAEEGEEGGEARLERMRKVVGKIKRDVEGCGWDEEREGEGERKVREARAVLRGCIEVR
jgi:hypothetical protein